MVNWDKINKKISIKKIVLPIFLVISIFLTYIYIRIFYVHICENKFAQQSEKISEKNSIPTFSIEKIYLCSSANGINNKDKQSIKDIDLYQYTDIAVYLNNYRENGLSSKNTVKKLYIDNILIELENENANTNLIYTNMHKIGSKTDLPQILNRNEKIEFNIVNTNEQNKEANYDNPTFYADCSNPITLKYINNLNKTYSIENDNTIEFDGTLLQKAGVTFEDINCKVKFKINIVNNDNEYYSAWFNFRLPLNDVFKGTSIKTKTTKGKDYNFFTIGDGSFL